MSLAVDPHTRAVTAVVELLHPFPSLKAADFAARIDGSAAAKKLLDAVGELRLLHGPVPAEDGRCWWPVNGSWAVLTMLRWLARLGPDPWGRRLVELDDGGWVVDDAERGATWG